MAGGEHGSGVRRVGAHVLGECLSGVVDQAVWVFECDVFVVELGSEFLVFFRECLYDGLVFQLSIPYYPLVMVLHLVDFVQSGCSWGLGFLIPLWDS